MIRTLAPRGQRFVRRRFARLAVGGIAVTLVALCLPGATAWARAGTCAPPSTGAPMFVTADCVDTDYADPVIDQEQDLTDPVPHHRVSGHFEGTDKKFTFYFPPAEQWQGRFFQLVYPLVDHNALPEDISFGASSGGYTVQTNGGSGYRVDAAAAKFAKVVAAKYYGRTDRIFGYVWGGSGGSYQTLGAMENSEGVWDGAVPFIPGVPVSIPHNFFLRAFARLVLRDKAPQIADAVAPGGSGDPYADLDATQRAVLAEVTKFGVPLRGWEDYRYLLGLDDPQGLLGFASAIKAMDPTYADDFWTAPGYLGTEQSPLGELIRAAAVDEFATITRVDRNAENVATGLALDSVPADPQAMPLDFTLYSADGTTEHGSLTGTLDRESKLFTIGSGNPAEVLNAIDAGAELRIDNRWYVALTTYTRHQVPARAGYQAFDQYRGADRRPKYPQRAMEVGPRISVGVTGGGTHTGKINGKVVLVTNLLDVDAFPWDGDWYADQVEQSLGKRSQDSFRLWYNDNADHIGPRMDRLVGYRAILEQALRDVSAWAEKGQAPADSTKYDITGATQVEVPGNAAARRGIQPVVELNADGNERIEISAGGSVTLRGKIQVPHNAGRVTGIEWSRTGSGDFASAPVEARPGPVVQVSQTFTYGTPGTYFPALRATTEREGADDEFAKVQNLDRVRVVVR